MQTSGDLHSCHNFNQILTAVIKQKMDDSGQSHMGRHLKAFPLSTDTTNCQTHIFTLGLVQHVALLPLAVGSFIGLADVELHLGALLVLHGLPLVQGHLFGAFIFHFFHLVLPGESAHNNAGP